MSGRRIPVPPDGCWQSLLRIWWAMHWRDGTPEKCQRPMPMPDDEPATRDEEADASSIGG